MRTRTGRSTFAVAVTYRLERLERAFGNIPAIFGTDELMNC